MSHKLMLTTKDNVFDPYTQFSDWLAEDIRLGHNTCGLIGRYAVQYGLTEDEEDDEDRWNEVLASILNDDFEDIYKIVSVEPNGYFDSKCLRF